MNDYRTIKYIINHLERGSLLNASKVNEFWNSLVLDRLSFSNWERSFVELMDLSKQMTTFKEESIYFLKTKFCQVKGIRIKISVESDSILILFSSFFKPNLFDSFLRVPDWNVKKFVYTTYRDCKLCYIPEFFSKKGTNQNLLVITLSDFINQEVIVVDYTNLNTIITETFRIPFNKIKSHHMRRTTLLGYYKLTPILGIEEHFLKNFQNLKFNLLLYDFISTGYKQDRSTLGLAKLGCVNLVFEIYCSNKIIKSFTLNANDNVHWRTIFYDRYLLIYFTSYCLFVDLETNQQLKPNLPFILYKSFFEIGQGYVFLLYFPSRGVAASIINCKTGNVQLIEQSFDFYHSKTRFEPVLHIKKRFVLLNFFCSVTLNFRSIKIQLLD